jgi:hypothetical protein
MMKPEPQVKKNNLPKTGQEAGAALAIAIIIVAILAVISLTALAFSSSEARMAGSDLQRTQTFYATASSLEMMTDNFAKIFRQKMRPQPADLTAIAAAQPAALTAEGFSFEQTLSEDTEKLTKLQTIQGLPSSVYPRVNIPEGPFAGLYATIVPYKISSTGTYRTGTEVKLEREFNNYLVPLFQFSLFSNDDMEMSPGPLMTITGRVHTNRNLYALSSLKFLSRVTMAGELVRDANEGGVSNLSDGKNSVWIEVNGVNAQIAKGSVQAGSGTIGGPNFVGSSASDRGYFPGSPNGVANPNWESLSVKPANGTAGRFGGQLLTRTTGATELKLPIQLAGNSAAELIKRQLPNDGEILGSSRYHTKAQVRILFDDETAGSGASNAAGIPAGKGVLLSTFGPSSLNGGKALFRIDNFGNYIDTTFATQNLPAACGGGSTNVTVVRRAKATIDATPDCVNFAPPGAGLQGRILIEIVRPDGTTIDVTQTILSMGITEGEPNAIVQLQRPLAFAYIQGSRDRNGTGYDLVSLYRHGRNVSDGELDPLNPADQDSTLGFISRSAAAETESARDASPAEWFNQIVPINVYNVREGWYNNSMDEFNVYERGMTNLVEINMRNMARWLDGIYDSNLLSGTSAVSTNIKDEQQGFVIYISDRRGDRVKAEYNPDGTSYLSTNGTVDNEDIYGPNNTLDPGEDVIDYGWDAAFGAAPKKGTLQKDTTELPDTGTVWYPTTPASTRVNQVMSWNNPNNYFRRAVRLFDAETLSFSAAANKLSPTKGITVASENMVYLWGNYNTTGVSTIPANGSTLNEGGYLGPQVPASIVCDAIFPLSKTWFDGLSAHYPEGTSDPRNKTGTAYRAADANAANVTQTTSVRAALLAGQNDAALNGPPGRDANGLRKSGGMNNLPRFLEQWNMSADSAGPWNYTGSMVTLFFSTQAISQWENSTSVTYMPPRRNWSFDSTYLNPNKLPPGTPFFQYLQTTGFRQITR